MSSTDAYVANAERYAARFDQGDLPMPPGKHTAVVACMDARLNPYGVLGLSEGDSHVIRNAGGVVTDDVIRSLTISQRLLGTNEIILIHHTDCGMLTFHDDDVKAQIEADTGIRPPFALEAFGDLDARCAPVHRPDQGQPVRPEQGLHPRLRLRGRDRPPPRGQGVSVGIVTG